MEKFICIPSNFISVKCMYLFTIFHWKCRHAQHKEVSMKCTNENTVFGYKKWWKTNSISFPKSLEAIYTSFCTIFIAFIDKDDSHWMDRFSVLFSRKSRKKKEKISVFVTATKTGQNSKTISLLKTLEVDYITIPPLFLTSSHFGRIYSQKHIFL